MDRKKDPMDYIIEEDLQLEAESIKRKIAEADVEELSDERKEVIKRKLYQQIAEYEREQAYKKLSEEDRQALELGRKMLKKKDPEYTEDEKVVYRKKRPKMWMILAAVMVLVMAIGVTGVGGAERIMEIIGIGVGTREVVQINSEDNYVIVNEKEEKAYQDLKDVFGVDPVKIIHRPEGMEFVAAEIDKDLQIALLIYDYNGNSVHYHISSYYTDNSWGLDVEDEVTNRYVIYHEKKGDIKSIEYEKPETKIKRYSANYEHNGLEYVLIGVMEKEEFEEIIKNLIFF